MPPSVSMSTRGTKMIRLAKQSDVDTILSLGEEFGHLMLYMKDEALISRYIEMNRIIVWEEPEGKPTSEYRFGPKVTGFYHFIVSGDPGFNEMLLHYRQMPLKLTMDSDTLQPGKLCVAMQGGCHRDVFKKLIQYLQSQYPIMWAWNSCTDPKAPSSKIQGYKDVGFKYSDQEIYSFFNIHKGDMSSYRLGRWKR